MKHGLKVHLEMITNSGRLRPQMGEAWIGSGDTQARLKRHFSEREMIRELVGGVQSVSFSCSCWRLLHTGLRVS